METIPRMTLDELYIQPFTARRTYDDEGRVSYVPLERNTTPTGQRHIDFILQSFDAGHADYDWIAARLGCQRSDLWGLIHILTGLEPREFRRQYLFRHADDLLRYTSLTLPKVARLVGAGTAANLCQLFRDNRGFTPEARRRQLQRDRDADRYRV